MGEGKSSVGVKVDENNAPIGEETRGSSSRRRDVVKSVSKASRRYNVTREQEAGFLQKIKLVYERFMNLGSRGWGRSNDLRWCSGCRFLTNGGLALTKLRAEGTTPPGQTGKERPRTRTGNKTRQGVANLIEGRGKTQTDLSFDAMKERR
ncbi:predicted protein [Aspergillus nidulans FGSC A4]|uniref:Uncharacterized protein n=1 Tax=Emericella nidulans (strain FGSC A4 / ATCC 38163 / CBS 112.46 / NRRL 194 / M139) TaxID=227321 RepID=Q5B6I5_EMENI|nr:hypothetical protein [Aspergillus nidulans FGSC A4]EAA59110.1 predicted protein [Aspergillus nidulans FGSC A4]CBF75256.1 TPA: hypothetical protein ANIA_03845 [Aspergillus nidulans FGSC A4]|eukprot:XP_661449.1 predicted protein [Aspergillus nidulans FGSC A4]